MKPVKRRSIRSRYEDIEFLSLSPFGKRIDMCCVHYVKYKCVKCGKKIREECEVRR